MSFSVKQMCFHCFLVAIEPILFRLACNEVINNILNELKFLLDLTTDYGVSCTLASKKFSYM